MSEEAPSPPSAKEIPPESSPSSDTTLILRALGTLSENIALLVAQNRVNMSGADNSASPSVSTPSGDDGGAGAPLQTSFSAPAQVPFSGTLRTPAPAATSDTIFGSGQRSAEMEAELLAEPGTIFKPRSKKGPGARRNTIYENSANSAEPSLCYSART